MLDVGSWVLEAKCWVLGVGCWVLEAERWMLDAGCWMLGIGYRMLDAVIRTSVLARSCVSSLHKGSRL